MKTTIKTGRFYISLPSKLHKHLQKLDTQFEEFNMDMAAWILHLILKENLDHMEYKPLCSAVLQKYDTPDFKTKIQLDILKQVEILKFLNHVHNIEGKENRCRSYRVSHQYLIGDMSEGYENYLTIHELNNKTLLNKINKDHKQNKIAARSTTPQLTEWLDLNYFKISEERAIEFITQKYKLDSNQFLHRYNMIINFDPSYSYQRSGKDDRLHSTFTQLASDLKQFVKYKNQALVEIDIISAQPFLLTRILEEMLDHYEVLSTKRYGVTKVRLKNRISKLLSNYINNDNEDYNNQLKYVIDIDTISMKSTIILLESLKAPDFTEIKNFISLIRSSQLYEYIGNEILSKGLIETRIDGYWIKLFDQTTNCQIDFHFETLRDCGKGIMINALYSKQGRSSMKAINVVRDLFPAVFLLVDGFKIRSHADLPLYLQRMEAKCVLDHCADNIAKLYPDMPLISRHDSLSTTVQNGQKLLDQFQLSVDAYFGTHVQLKEIEHW